jgi:hypothetical protein
MAENLKRRKAASKIRPEWLIGSIKYAQKRKSFGLRRKTVGIMLSESAEL